MSEQNNPSPGTVFDRRRLLFTVMAIAFALRLIACWQWRDELATDRDGYLAIADNLRTGGGFSTDGEHPTAFRPPLYPLVLAGGTAIGGEIAVAVLQILLGTVTVWLTARIGCNLGEKTAGLIAAGLVAVDPLLLRYTPQLMTESLFTFLIVLLFVQITRPQSGETTSTLRSIALGFTFGLCALCRPTIWAFGGFVTMIWLVRCMRLRTLHPSHEFTFRTPCLIATGALITVAPWIIRNAISLQRPIAMTTHGGYTLLLGNNPVFYDEVVRQPMGTVWKDDSLTRWQRSLEAAMQAESPPPATELERDRWMFHRAVGHMRDDPGGFLAASGLRFLRFWNITPSGDTDMKTALRWAIGGFYSLVFLAAFIGLWRLDRASWRRWWPAAALLLSFTAVHLFYWSNTRMRAPLVPIIALLAARSCTRRIQPKG